MPSNVLAAPAAFGSSVARPRVAFAAGVAGLGLVVESVTSIVIDAHVGYHAVNVVLNAALFIASVGVARTGRTGVGWAGVIGGWATGAMALLAATGGVWTLLAEGLGSSDTPGAVEGISHTAVLASFLFLVPFGLGLRRLGWEGPVIAGSSACLVAMVLAGLDQPEAFLLPEAVLGAAWLLLARAVASGGDVGRK